MAKKVKKIPEPKPLFVERINKLLTNKEDNQNYWEILKHEPVDSIRCNKLKISPEKLKENLEKIGWKIKQPWEDYPEVMIVEGKEKTGKSEEIILENGFAKLEPGELGRNFYHLLGYFYIQELSSMLPVIALQLNKKDTYLDLCAAPGSKTTQAASEMNNEGLIIANEVSMGRMRILSSNLEKAGITNTIVTRKEGQALCRKLNKVDIKFDKILIDAPCSGEGTLRSSPKTYIMWNPKTIKYLSRVQKQLFSSSFKELKVGGELIYSTCTHAPEENEGVVSEMLEKFGDSIEIMDFKLPLKTREGLTEWNEEKYDKRVKLAKRVYPQDNNTEGFFVSKFKKLKEVEEK